MPFGPPRKLPSAAVLKKYGITIENWLAMYEAQGGRCAICGVDPPSGRLNVDHDHVRGWKKMPDGERAKHVRGLLCWTCNLYIVGRGVTVERLRAALAYLQRSV
jgi:hypothetical protein